jgi:uncharacterized phage infection (PIP) family protein YhgE
MSETEILDALEKEANEQDALLSDLKSLSAELATIDKQADLDTSSRGMTKTDFAVLKGAIDADNATISGVSVITVGEARGHGMQVDAQTLAEVKAAAETYAGGLKVKTDHFSGFNQIVGTLKNFKITGDQLRADLFLLKNHDATARILEMAELMPDTFGLSISFTGEHEESDNDIVFARCTEIYSADLVDAPAANPTGLFSAKVDSAKKVMDEKQIADAIAAALAPVIEDMAAMQAKLAKLEETTPEDEEKVMEEHDDKKEMTEDEEKSEDMSAKLAAELAEIKSLFTNFGAKPVAPAVAVEVKADAAAPTNFSEALAVVKAEGLTGSAATKAVIARFPDLYLAARNSGIRTL